MSYGLVRIKRRCIPEWLWRIFAHRFPNHTCRPPLVNLLTRKPSEHEQQRINGFRWRTP